ncbi:MAG: hypothetical protein UR39_C0003G0133 [Candidatus Woesebacteria bacterium GW2011_GWA1_33_30]|uniref:Uncharacterized protein n=1 Tax=Candidatus Woesebacteria bacterium GW2011_GWA2_33_28 TaxID=1618561 RepID=A0A0G0A8X7_9BACT|nr:MAG: hypothetical protein UR38_C0003G0136 [Candidatus Woesebacteria bacterium GW2011_GWA2_33_28]KKP48598.1 MAG: hypothetical protein UR39_C0003G0133 [Candidatus Woesebacteria bacterium GW2011_GWA1_33_30]KKP49737.1 MAG: hypothetical protein UR40_C0004G0136 [Microgenomates group bacterium GW2011_GWC1_33_32]KKP52354.1 MAG: hypothetical protein UR44_C0003G0136 [Candidatus Woesebacteria bacterium GW2011_GWB1_33_38]KKP57045.1 MAG: hypothetical protein UR48_C0024G0008 [Microgenomates group bacteriu
MIHTAICNFCKKDVHKSVGRLNEEKKLGWKSYCSRECLGMSRRNRKDLTCSRAGCKNKFFRVFNQYRRFKNHYCSHRCLAIVVNSRRILKSKQKCKLCNNFLKYGKTYCSPKCKQLGMTQSGEFLLSWIRQFYKDHSRIPLKRECIHYHAVRIRFKGWNNAILVAGFDPNPVMFAKKYLANDGHKCDSLSERIIDDWLSRRNINHQRSVPYPNNEQFTADFVVDKYWIEFFGLSGELKRYDYLKRKKLRLAKKLDLNLIKLYPKDLFPKGNLNNVLKILIS